MSGLLFFMGILTVMSVLSILAQAFGVDSRPELEDDRAPAWSLS